jgi:hypothetical protein
VENILDQFDTKFVYPLSFYGSGSNSFEEIFCPLKVIMMLEKTI